ncbi:hypothetical protein NEF87_003282 [Candidatus Lokiarchaeum ossiferum]|uniref:Isoprenylcysteine carboxylmethyltransferase family protein n=1 Tax=Candidatus Lokiarchaeum ossiferum TaxID=2951803 RepID=A0ABY6HTZ3_9ARCH|nr:hypothetical protein NEF87_003282 [Candidatus Lokiarchaeum sp. B-35]
MNQESHQVPKNNRKDLGKTVSRCDLKQVILFFSFLIFVSLDLLYLKIDVGLNLEMKWYYRLVISLPLFIIGIIIAKKSMVIMYYEVRSPPVVVDWGPFRYSRHPMYLSALLFYFGITVFSFSVVGIIYYLFIYGFYGYLAHFEENHLISQYQEAYVDYKKQVLKWIDFRHFS